MVSPNQIKITCQVWDRGRHGRLGLFRAELLCFREFEECGLVGGAFLSHSEKIATCSKSILLQQLTQKQ